MIDVIVFCCRDGLVSIQEYMAFMISRETENVQSAQDVEAAFRALTSSDRPFITSQELYAVSRTSSVARSRHCSDSLTSLTH